VIGQDLLQPFDEAEGTHPGRHCQMLRPKMRPVAPPPSTCAPRSRSAVTDDFVTAAAGAGGAQRRRPGNTMDLHDRADEIVWAATPAPPVADVQTH
jgi:hypothetical protein